MSCVSTFCFSIFQMVHVVSTEEAPTLWWFTDQSKEVKGAACPCFADLLLFFATHLICPSSTWRPDFCCSDLWLIAAIWIHGICLCHSLTHSLTPSLARSLARSLTHSLTHSLWLLADIVWSKPYYSLCIIAMYRLSCSYVVFSSLAPPFQADGCSPSKGSALLSRMQADLAFRPRCAVSKATWLEGTSAPPLQPIARRSSPHSVQGSWEKHKAPRGRHKTQQLSTAKVRIQQSYPEVNSTSTRKSLSSNRFLKKGYIQPVASWLYEILALRCATADGTSQCARVSRTGQGIGRPLCVKGVLPATVSTLHV